MQDNLISIPLRLPEFSAVKTQIVNEEIEIELKPRHPYAIRPHCSKASRKVHAADLRVAFDMPIHEKKVKLIVHTRRFRCQNCDKVFTEEFESIRPRSRMRKTLRGLDL